MKALTLVLMIASALAIPVSGEARGHCLAGRRDALIRGQFSGPIICSSKDATFRLVGLTNGSGFAIYDYRYRFLPPSGAVRHGGQRLVIFRGRNYVGQYALSPPPYSEMTVIGASLRISKAGTSEVAKIDLARRLPERIFVDGEIQALFR